MIECPVKAQIWDGGHLVARLPLTVSRLSRTGLVPCASPVLVVAEGLHAGTTFSQADGVDADAIAGRVLVPARHTPDAVGTGPVPARNP